MIEVHENARIVERTGQLAVTIQKGREEGFGRQFTPAHSWFKEIACEAEVLILRARGVKKRMRKVAFEAIEWWFL